MFTSRLIALVAMLCAVLAASCRQTEPPEQATGDLRIVSLSPALTQTLIDLDLADAIVGRSNYCKGLSPVVPAVGDLQTVDYEAIIRLEPTHVLVQPPKAGIDAELLRLAGDRGWTLGQWMLNGVDDIERVLVELPRTLAADRPGLQQDLAQRCADATADIARALAPGEADLWTGRVLLVSSTSPVMAFGSGTYLDDILRAFGSTNIVESNGWVTLSLEDITRLEPQAIILVQPASGGQNAGPLADLEVDAVASERVAFLTNEFAFLPCTQIVSVADELRAILAAFHDGGG